MYVWKNNIMVRLYYKYDTRDPGSVTTKIDISIWDWQKQPKRNWRKKISHQDQKDKGEKVLMEYSELDIKYNKK